MSESSTLCSVSHSRGMNTPPPVAGLTDPDVARQKNIMETLIGTWGDKRETEEIAKDIYAARTLGREVNLWHYGRIEGLVIENWFSRQNNSPSL